MKNHGYSLLEMLFVLALATAAIGVSVPFLLKYRENSDFESVTGKIAAQMRQTKMLAVTKGESYTVCVPLGKTNSENKWKFFTVRNTNKICERKNLKIIIENDITYRVFQKNKKTEIKNISFFPGGTSTNKSFCIENKNGNKWKKITVSNFARITVTAHNENPCD